MGVPKGKNNFASHQSEVVEGNTQRIEAELKDVRGRAGANFEDIDSLVRYVAKVTGIHRTTLKRNTIYRRLLRDFLARRQGSTPLGKIDEASPELLREMIEERNTTIRSLINQARALNEKLNRMEQTHGKLAAPAVASTEIAVGADKAAASMNADAAFQDTAFALLQLIQHINRMAGTETIVIDEKENLILDAAISDPAKRMEMAIGPERTKAFVRWLKANKHLL